MEPGPRIMCAQQHTQYKLVHGRQAPGRFPPHLRALQPWPGATICRTNIKRDGQATVLRKRWWACLPTDQSDCATAVTRYNFNVGCIQS